jgi:hypothetical protein
MVYVKLSDNFWYQMPAWFNDITYNFNFSNGVFTIYTTTTDRTPENIEEVKLVIVRGSAQTIARKSEAKNFGDYLETARTLHLQP